jgi:aminoglycoside phosphotransferase (APT) family kinase protein
MMIDIEQSDSLLAYLRETGHIEPDEQPAIRVLQGGVSNRTVLVERSTGEAWVLKQALEKLRVKVNWLSSPERIHREALGLRWLTQLAPPVIPAFVFEDGEQHILAMQQCAAARGWKVMLLAGRLDSAHIGQFGWLLGTIQHRASARRAEIEPLFRDRSFFESLRLEPYYLYTATQVPEAGFFLHTLIDETRALALTLVHGDYSPKNVLVYQGRLVLLDYEVIHFGDPAFDLGFSLTHLLSKAHHLPGLRSDFVAAAVQYWRCYGESLGAVDWIDTLEARAVGIHSAACWRVLPDDPHSNTWTTLNDLASGRPSFP